MLLLSNMPSLLWGAVVCGVVIWLALLLGSAYLLVEGLRGGDYDVAFGGFFLLAIMLGITFVVLGALG